MTCCLGFDIGGTHIRCVATGESAGAPNTNREVRPLPKTLEGIIADIAEMTENQLIRCQKDDEKKLALGVGCAGTITSKGVVEGSPNIPQLVGADLKTLITSSIKPLAKLKKDVVVENDVTAAAFGESILGNHGADFIYLAFGTGIGAGRILNGRLFKGANNFWGEAGHMQVSDREKEICGCGRTGCWEQLASGTALGRLAADFIKTGKAPELAKVLMERAGSKADTTGAKIKGEDIAEFLADDTPTPEKEAVREECRQILDELAGWMAVGIQNLISICDPGCIILGGGLLKLGEKLLTPLNQKLENTPGTDCPLYIGSDIEWIGALGACELARQN